MVSRKTLNAKNLETLGAPHLAELLMEISKGNATAKRRLRMELAENLSSDELAREVRKRLNTIARSESFIDWYNIKETAADLENQRKAIVEKIGPSDPAEAASLLWQFLRLAEGLFERCDDSNGVIIDIFHEACENLGVIAQKTEVSTDSLAEKIFEALKENGYGQYDYLIRNLAPALGDSGLATLKTRFQDWQAEPFSTPPESERQVIGWGSGGPTYKDEIERMRKKSTCSLALKEIADLQGDAESFMAQYDEQTKKVPRIAAEIAMRLLKTDRAEEALDILDRAKAPRHDFLPEYSWENARIAVLDALGRKDEAQTFRWQCFEKTLEGDFLRAYLKNLPDFEDFEAEQNALEHALKHPEFHRALAFLVTWPALEKASALVISRHGEVDGNLYEVLTPTAEALEAKYPLAATMLRRAMIDYILEHKKTSRYRHAARHLKECESLESAIKDYGDFETHQAFHERLQSLYGGRRSFWADAA